MVMFDSLNRHFLPPYGCDWVHAPNFQRLAQRGVTFNNCYAGSMPCMPARRELHTGRYNFLHRGWGPIEPFDDSMPEMLRKNGVHAHLASDHYHYWEEGGCNYHTRYSTWEAFRGQEGDPWKANLTDDVHIPESLNLHYKQNMEKWMRQDWVNRHYTRDEKDMPQAKTFEAGLDFLRTNAAADRWFLHLETFDPHEPYQVPQRFLDLYKHLDDWDGPHFDWPPYKNIAPEEKAAVKHLRLVNAALVSMCDEYLGRLLDVMDELDLWKDTLLIVNTDHGFLLGEHDFWGKCAMPFYNEVIQTPLFVWDPRCGLSGRRRNSLVQTIDLAPTLLDYFGVERTPDMQGVPLRKTLVDDTPVREAALFGLFGGHVNCTDGRYVYMRAPAGKENGPLYEYTHMPTHMRRTFTADEMRTMEGLADPFSFTKGCRTMKIPSRGWSVRHQFHTMLFDLQTDPAQNTPIDDPAAEKRMIELMTGLMKANDAPPEQYQRLGLEKPV
jgi:arylsulfatase A-like enzyme